MSRFIKVRVIRSPALPGPDGRVRTQINYNQLRIVHAMSKSHVFIRNAIEHLKGALLGGGILIRRNGAKEPMALEPMVEHLIQTEWVAFCRELLRDLMVYGFAIVALDLKKKCPMTLDPATTFSDISISHDVFGGERQYEVTVDEVPRSIDLGHGMSQTPAPPMFVVEMHAPTREGDLTSLCRVLLPEDAFINTMKQCAIAAAQRNSRPAFITKTDQQTPESKAVQQSTAVIGDSTLATLEQQAVQHRNHAEALVTDVEAIRRANLGLEDNAAAQMQDAVEAHNAGEGWQQLMHVKRSYGINASGNSTVVVDNVTGAVSYPEVVGAKQYMSAFIALPPHQSLESPPTASAPAQIPELMELYRDQVAGVMGVPSVLWGSTRSSVAANQTVLNTFNDTKQWYRVILITVIQRLFTCLFRERLDKQNLAEIRQILASLTHDAGDKVNKVKDAHKEHTQGDRNISVALPGMLDNEILTNYTELGVLPWETLISAVSAYSGLPKEMLAEEKIDPLSGKPQSQVQKETEEREEEMMDKQAEIQKEVETTKIKMQASAKVPGSKKPLSNQPAKKKPKH